jgi:glycosyltransferase involved in cell wall biosynthesis
MRILLIGPLPPPLGGTTVMFAQMVRELPAVADVEISVIDTSRGNAMGRIAELFAALRVLVQLPSHLATADVVTFHASPPATAYFGPILLLLCRIWRRPLLVREFGGSLDVDYAALGPIPRWLVERLFASAWMLLETRFQVSHFEKLFPGSRCRWYPNSRPLEPQVTNPAPRDGSGAQRFVFMGHVKPVKGLGELLQASRMLGSRPIHIDVYGPLLDGFQESAFEGHSRVTYRGVISPEEVGETLRRYDVLVLPTHHPGEGYPGVLLEAWAEGLPVLTTRWRSLPEIVRHGVNGILIEPRDPAGLAEAMCRIHDDPELLTLLRAGTRPSAEEFSSLRWTREFADLCREALGSADRSRMPARS